MPSSYTSGLRIEQPATGEQTNTWGQTLDTGLSLLDAAITGVTTIATAGGLTSLTANNGSADQARAAILLVTGTLTSNATILIPNTPKIYIIRNQLTLASLPYGLSIQVANTATVLDLQLNGGTIVFDGTTIGCASSTELFQNLSTGDNNPCTDNVQGTFINSGTVQASANAAAGQIPLGLNLVGATNGNVLASFTASPDVPLGSITFSNGGVAYNQTSDYRVKSDLRPVRDALKRLCKLRVYRGRIHGGRLQDMFLAHEVQAVIPPAVTGKKDAVGPDGKPKLQQLDQTKLIPLLTAAVTELAERVARLERG